MTYRQFGKLCVGDRIRRRYDNKRGRIVSRSSRNTLNTFGEICVVWDDGKTEYLDDVSDYIDLVKEVSG